MDKLDVIARRFTTIFLMYDDFFSENPIMDVVPTITLCTLDIVCETSMGRSVNAQSAGDSDYVKAVHRINDIVQERTKQPLMWSDTIFHLLVFLYFLFVLMHNIDLDRGKSTMHVLTSSIRSRRKSLKSGVRN